MTPERFEQFSSVTAPIVERNEAGEIVSPFWDDVCWACTGHDISYGGGMAFDMDKVSVGDELLEYLSETVRRISDPELKKAAQTLLPSRVVPHDYDLHVRAGAFSRGDGGALEHNRGAVLIPERR